MTSYGSIRVYVNPLKKILGAESIVNIKGIGDFECAIIATLFLLSTTASIYLAHSLTELFYATIKNFRLLIEDTMHEINTPVGTIKTNTSMLKKRRMRWS